MLCFVSAHVIVLFWVCFLILYVVCMFVESLSIKMAVIVLAFVEVSIEKTCGTHYLLVKDDYAS